MDTTELCYTPATELARLIRARQLSPVELIEAVLQRLDRLNPRLNAFLTVTADLAREQAQASEGRQMRGELIGPLDGIPYSIKDLQPTSGIRTTYGSRWFADHVPSQDGVVAARLRATGGVLLGKTNTPHFGYLDKSDNLLGPPARNPWRLDRTPGGSSGGAGAAVAAGLGPLAHGSDGAGSIRTPAALCGIVGMKPSFGRIPHAPNADYWAARSHNGPMTRTVRDAALLLQAMAGPDPRDPLSIDATPEDYLAACDGELRGAGRAGPGGSLRVAFSADLGYGVVHSEVRALAERAALRFNELGCAVEARDPAWDDPGHFHRVLYRVGLAASMDRRVREHPDWIEPTFMEMIEEGRRYSAVEHKQAQNARGLFYDQAVRFFERYDLLLTPTSPMGAWPAEPGPGPFEIEGRPLAPHHRRSYFLYPFNLTGQPAITVPCGFTSEGLPVGLQIVGRWHADALVLRAAAAFEAAQPWVHHRPPLD